MVPHSQLVAVRGLLRVGKGWASGLPHPSVDSSDLQPDSLLALRRLLGKSVDRNGEGKAPSGGRKAVGRAVVEGLRVVREAQTAAKGHLGKLRKTLSLRRWLGLHFRAWRMAVLLGGPARCASLATR